MARGAASNPNPNPNPNRNSNPNPNPNPRRVELRASAPREYHAQPHWRRRPAEAEGPVAPE